jgi:peptidoglycan/xylan/chitin deacetylase (PgdA/CDA1 family)
MRQNKFRAWVNKEVQKKLDQQPFSSLPLKMRWGIFLLAGSYLGSYILPPLIILIAGSHRQLVAGLVGGAFFYALSWGVGMLGLVLAGKDSLQYPVYFFAKAMKRLFPKYFDTRAGSRTALSKFALVNIATLLLLTVFAALAFFNFSVYWIAGGGLVILVHQALYIRGMFSHKSDYFFKLMRGRDYFKTGQGILFRFDDGPDPVYTPRILEILKAESLRALFAVTGKNAENYPDILRQIQMENHIIGNHTYSHPYHFLLLGYKRIYEEISRTNEIIKDITGQEPEFFCPPIGQKNAVVGRVIRSLKLKPIMWDIHTGDTWFSTDKIVKKIKKEITAHSIILFHDGVLPWSKNQRECTVEALQATIRFLKQTGRI